MRIMADVCVCGRVEVGQGANRFLGDDYVYYDQGGWLYCDLHTVVSQDPSSLREVYVKTSILLAVT